MERIRVLTGDWQPVFRLGLRSLIERDPAFIVVAEAEDGEQALRLADMTAPDVVLINTNLPGLDGLQVTREIKLRLPHVAIVLLTESEQEEELFYCVRYGGSAYMRRDASAEELIDVIQRVSGVSMNSSARGIAAVAPKQPLLEMTSDCGEDASAATVKLTPLSPREAEVLELAARGQGNKEIARVLNISDQTVKNHMTAITRKLAVTGRTQAVVCALQQGWIRLRDESEDIPICKKAETASGHRWRSIHTPTPTAAAINFHVS